MALAEWESIGREKTEYSKLQELVLGKKQFKQVAKVSEGFDQYMTDLMGGRDESTIAANSGQRLDFRPKDAKNWKKKEVSSSDDSDSDGDSDEKPPKKGKKKAADSDDGVSSDDEQSKRKGKDKEEDVKRNGKKKNKSKSRKEDDSDSD